MRGSLPEVDVCMVEDVDVHVQVVECLRSKHHGHIVSLIQQRHCLQEEGFTGHLHHRSVSKSHTVQQ